MRRNLATMALFCAAFLLAAATLRADNHKKVTLKGYLMDKACASKVVKSEDPATKAKGHKKECALMEGCAASGYGVVSEGKFHAFDKAGNEIAAKWLQATGKTDNLAIEVVGAEQTDGTIKVESLKESE